MGLNVFESLRRGVSETVDLPRVDAFAELYELGVRPRRGQLIMVAGRSGSQKSGFVLFWAAQMGLPTLYFSGDMSPFTAGVRLASIATGWTSDEVEDQMGSDFGESLVTGALGESKADIDLVFASPITWDRVVAELNLYVMLRNELPELVVLDNLMDFEGAENDYEAQMQTMQDVSSFARELGVTVVVLHHASDKSWDAKNDPHSPPSRDQIKNGLSEKPELTLTVALGAHLVDEGLEPVREFRVACVKQRDGACDPSAGQFAILNCDPSRTQFWDRRRKRQ